eukprot:CAMPEP_0194218224 /NCGR_PEP_ID=MMETSP0156-20130528/23273_1 /TAXON_ID=33649 /ORGANISM="Thalassionema nitzschioides, Strain L26-B" /LENGTH=535 /DNA_ID=CAMNT_0038947505 /DNA_START=192 /DNA_END=1799 /DNA_ORIENTATION=+
MDSLKLPLKVQRSIREQVEESDLDSPDDLILLARDFVDRPEVFSDLLQSDFGFPALMAHRVRATVMEFFQQEEADLKKKSSTKLKTNGKENNSIFVTDGNSIINLDETETAVKKPIYKKVVVNENASRRKQNNNDAYGLPKNYKTLYVTLGKELDDFYSFMTKPSTASQESPIRDATAKVYFRHAKLFLGWFIGNRINEIDPESISLRDIFPNKERESADNILNFVLWLQTTRSISVSYEANLLRGLIKLLKFRFSRESLADPSYGEKSFDDIPMIREIRRLHRDANKRQSVSPRSSNEDRKWLTWSDYLKVIQDVKVELAELIADFETKPPRRSSAQSKARKIAIFYQYYLVLAFFACVPDRQRTIRELEIGRTFIKDQGSGLWMIKHGPDDYKTGKTYGDRPPLMLSKELVPSIDEFLQRWRSHLNPETDALFCQPRTGRPLTQDSVYQIVARNCYKYTGKKTNPHLLRDMIVTHVRDSDASEKQLEALALYMGHSIQMQRSSYDRRTLQRKVAPAVELLQNVNQNANSSQDG